MFHNDDFSQIAAAIPVFVKNNLEGKSGYIPGDKLGRIFQNMNGKGYEPEGCRYVLAHQKDVVKEVMVGLKANRFEMNEATAAELVAAFIPILARQMKAFSQAITDDVLQGIPLEGKQAIGDKSQADLDRMRGLILGGLGFALSQRLLFNDPDACVVDGKVYDPARHLVALLGQICTNYADQIMEYDAAKDNSHKIAADCIGVLQALDVKDANNNAALRVLEKCGIRNALQLAEAQQKSVDAEKARAGDPAKLGKGMHLFGAAEKARPEDHWQAEPEEIRQPKTGKPSTAPGRLESAADAPEKKVKAPKTSPLSRISDLFKGSKKEGQTNREAAKEIFSNPYQAESPSPVVTNALSEPPKLSGSMPEPDQGINNSNHSPSRQGPGGKKG